MKPIDLAKELYPIHRSITGEGVRESLKVIKEFIDILEIKSYKSGEKCFDWEIPPEWSIKSGWIKDLQGNKVIDLHDNNLHVISYSDRVQGVMKREDLMKKIYTIPKQPNAIPYITSYYDKNWGFCMSENQKQEMKDEYYEVNIDSDFDEAGEMNYGEILIPGKSSKEVLLSTYICHPSMANNEISGPVVSAFVSKWLQQLANRKYTYRILFLPETIGSIAYISKNLDYLRAKLIAGFVLTCIGDTRNYSYVPSKYGKTLADEAAKIALFSIDKSFKQFTWNDRGSDERQYCAPGVNLPVCSIMRTKYCEFPEYHSSLDDFNLVTNIGLEGGIEAIRRTIQVIESNEIPECKIKCEPQLGRRGLYPSISNRDNYKKVQNMLNVISYCDGSNDMISISKLCKLDYFSTKEIVDALKEKGILRVVH
ncbi:DUF4910 domain-containing protein [Synechococcus sp. MU1617]|uniref:DUF4910 domain-containing protein n=1 Tax=Synechococcus sp. MU1617 TaxID=2508346 RepID=UPI001CF8C0D7|nr:DUF4910 domain-containing protein [Synechococcus sp. MU1617]